MKKKIIPSIISASITILTLLALRDVLGIDETTSSFIAICMGAGVSTVGVGKIKE